MDYYAYIESDTILDFDGLWDVAPVDMLPIYEINEKYFVFFA